MFTSILGENGSNFTMLHIFQMGWFNRNHQRTQRTSRFLPKPTGFVQLQLLRDESDLGLESQQPKAPVNEAKMGEIFGLDMLSKSTGCFW